MKRGRSAVTSSKVSYAIRYTASTLSVHEALGLGVVVGIAAPAHGAGETVLLQGGAIVIGGILPPTVGMMHATPWWIAGADGGVMRAMRGPRQDRTEVRLYSDHRQRGLAQFQRLREPGA